MLQYKHIFTHTQTYIHTNLLTFHRLRLSVIDNNLYTTFISKLCIKMIYFLSHVTRSCILIINMMKNDNCFILQNNTR